MPKSVRFGLSHTQDTGSVFRKLTHMETVIETVVLFELVASSMVLTL